MNGRAQARAVSHVFKRMRQHLQDKLARVLDLFRAMDDNGDGHIQPEELGPALAQLGFEASGDELALAYGALDRDGDGKVDYHELIRTLKDTDTVRQARIYELRMPCRRPKYGRGSVCGVIPDVSLTISASRVLESHQANMARRNTGSASDMGGKVRGAHGPATEGSAAAGAARAASPGLRRYTVGVEDVVGTATELSMVGRTLLKS